MECRPGRATAWPRLDRHAVITVADVALGNGRDHSGAGSCLGWAAVTCCVAEVVARAAAALVPATAACEWLDCALALFIPSCFFHAPDACLPALARARPCCCSSSWPTAPIHEPASPRAAPRPLRPRCTQAGQYHQQQQHAARWHHDAPSVRASQSRGIGGPRVSALASYHSRSCSYLRYSGGRLENQRCLHGAPDMHALPCIAHHRGADKHPARRNGAHNNKPAASRTR